MTRVFPHCNCEDQSKAEWDVVKGKDIGFFRCRTCKAQGIVIIKD